MIKKMSIILGASSLLLGAAVQATPITDGKVKWQQLPDMIEAEDNLSMHRSGGPVVADDFVSNGKEIIGFHWWGSYLTDPDTGQPFDTGQGPERNVSFEISFHQNCPANDATCNNGGPFSYSTPRDGNYFSAIFVVEEDFFGTTANGVDIYEYWVRVNPDIGPSFLNNTWEEIAGETYWVDFAWNAGQFGTSFGDDVWGWAKAANGGVCILDCAVTTAPNVPGNPHIGPWVMLQDEDKAFEVIGVPEPATLTLFLLGLAGAGVARGRKPIR